VPPLWAILLVDALLITLGFRWLIPRIGLRITVVAALAALIAGACIQ
jgi:hypothetical protein